MRSYRFLLVLGVTCCATAYAQDPGVGFVTAPGASEIKLTLERTRFEHAILVEATKDAKVVKVEATDLAGPVRVLLNCTVAGSGPSAPPASAAGDGKAEQTTGVSETKSAPCSTPFALSKGESRAVRLSAGVDAIGTYSGVLAVVADGARRNVILSVTRNPSPMPVELAASVPATATRNRALDVEVPLQEKFGLPTELWKPALTLTRREVGKPTAEGVVLPHTVSVNGVELGASWPVGSRAAPVLRFSISSIGDAGEYNGRVRLTSPSSTQALDVPISFTKADSWVMASFLIAVGALVSYFLRLYLKTIRPRLAQQRTAAMLMLDIERLRSDLTKSFAPLQEEEIAVVTAISARLTSIDRPLDEITEADAAKVLTEVDTRLSFVRRWVNGRRRAETLSNLPDDVRTKLTDVGRILQQPQLPDATDVGTKLRDAEDAISKELSAEVAARVAALTTAIDSSAYLKADERLKLKSQVTSAKGMLDDNARRSQLDAVEGELVATQVTALRSELIAVTTPPIGFDDASWLSLVGEVKRRLKSAEEAAKVGDRNVMFAEALRYYLEAVRSALGDRLKVGRKKVELSANATDDEKNAALATMAPLELENEAIRQKISDGKLSEAQTMLAKHAEEVKKLEAGLGARNFLNASTQVDAAAAPSLTTLDLGSVGLSSFSGLALRGERFTSLEPKGWKALLASLDTVVLVVALAISVLLGLKLLWVDNATWGSVNDYVIAILWGLGLHQVSNAAFDGIGGMIDKWGK